MTGRTLLHPSDATHKLVRQFDAGHETFAIAEAEMSSTLEAAQVITSLVADTFTSDLFRQHDRFMYLSIWHRSVKDECSRRYGEIRADNPELDKAAVNSERDLQLLNGIRRGVHEAMIRANCLQL